MERIESRIELGKLLHFIVRRDDFLPGRQDLISPNNFLQCAMLNLEKGKTFRAHRHKWKHREEEQIAQESWCVVKGIVKVFFYDLDNTLLLTTLLYAGDTSFTLEGGHNYEIFENDTRVMEYKCTRYTTQAEDKEFI